MATKRFAPKLHIKSGDTVTVIAGDDKGKSGVVVRVIPSESRAIVEGLNIVTKHRKPNRAAGEQSGSIEKNEAPIHISNLMVNDASGTPTRIGRRIENGKSVRYSKKSGNTIK